MTPMYYDFSPDDEETTPEERFGHLTEELHIFRQKLKRTISRCANHQAYTDSFRKYVRTPREQAVYDSYISRFNALTDTLSRMDREFQAFYTDCRTSRKKRHACTDPKTDTFISAAEETFRNFQEEYNAASSTWKVLWNDFDDFQYDLVEKAPPAPQPEKFMDMLMTLSEKTDRLSKKADELSEKMDRKFTEVEKHLDSIEKPKDRNIMSAT